MCWPEWEVPSEGALFSSGFVVKICDFLHFVYTFEPNYRKLSTDLDHRQKPNHWTLCFFFLSPSHIITCTTDISTSVCGSSPDLSRATYFFLTVFLSFWSMSAHLLSCFLSLFEHPNLCWVSHWVAQIKAKLSLELVTECLCVQVISHQAGPSNTLVLSSQGAQLQMCWSAVQDEQKMEQLHLWCWSQVYNSVN